MALSGRQFLIVAGEHEATVVEVGGGLRRYAHRGADVTCTYPDDVLPPKCCGAVLVPWPNRLRDGHYTFDGAEQQLALTDPSNRNAIHGLGRWARWSLVRHEPDAVTLGLDVVPQTGYPFEVRIEVTYALDAERGLSVTTVARNTGTTRLPFGAGFHPYLSTRGVPLAETTLRLPASLRLQFDARQLPVGTEAVDGTPHDFRTGRPLGETRMDAGFTGLSAGDAEVRTGHGGARLWFDDAFGYLQVFTLEPFPGGGAGIAIEPMTCAPDAFNSGDGLLALDPGGTWTGAWGISPLTAGLRTPG